MYPELRQSLQDFADGSDPEFSNGSSQPDDVGRRAEPMADSSASEAGPYLKPVDKILVCQASAVPDHHSHESCGCCASWRLLR